MMSDSFSYAGVAGADRIQTTQRSLDLICQPFGRGVPQLWYVCKRDAQDGTEMPRRMLQILQILMRQPTRQHFKQHHT